MNKKPFLKGGGIGEDDRGERGEGIGRYRNHTVPYPDTGDGGGEGPGGGQLLMVGQSRILGGRPEPE